MPAIQSKTKQVSPAKTRLADDDLKKELENFYQLCRDEGIKITIQRQAVYLELFLSQEHLSPESIYLRVREEYPAISLGTVYKILDTFHQHKITRKIFGAKTAHYDTKHKPHQHFICDFCGTITDVHLEPSQLPSYQPPCGVTLTVDIYFRGICTKCNK